jgi:hypothetical protein
MIFLGGWGLSPAAKSLSCERGELIMSHPEAISMPDAELEADQECVEMGSVSRDTLGSQSGWEWDGGAGFWSR